MLLVRWTNLEGLIKGTLQPADFCAPALTLPQTMDMVAVDASRSTACTRLLLFNHTLLLGPEWALFTHFLQRTSQRAVWYCEN